MKRSITIEEKFSRYWTSAVLSLLALSIMFFLLFYQTDEPVWEGIWRVISFVFFAGSILSFLKVIDGKKKVTISMEDNELALLYKKGDDVVSEGSIDKDKIECIKTILFKYKIPLLGIQYTSHDTYDLLVKLNKSEQLFHLLDYAGSALRVDRSAVDKLSSFLEEHNIPVISN